MSLSPQGTAYRPQGTRRYPAALGPAGVSYLGQVATNCSCPIFLSGSASFRVINSRTRHIATDNITSLQVVSSQWIIDHGREVNPTGTGGSTIEASIEYGPGSTSGPVDANCVRVLWAGVNIGLLPTGTNVIISDDTAITIPIGAIFYVNICRKTPSATIPVISNTSTTLVDTANGEIFQNSATGAASKVMTPTTMTNNQTTFAQKPLLLLGQTTRSSVFCVGDSICFGQADVPDGTSTDIGLVTRSMGGQYGYSNFGSPGANASDFVSGNFSRVQALVASYFTHVLCEIGRNDLGPSTLAQLKLDIVAMWNLFPGKRIGQTTITPQNTASGNDWTQLGTQTTDAQNANRIAMRTFILSLPAPLNKAFDMGPTLESSLNSGKWASPGSIAQTVDGVHPSPAGYQTAKDSGVIVPGDAFFARY